MAACYYPSSTLKEFTGSSGTINVRYCNVCCRTPVRNLGIVKYNQAPAVSLRFQGNFNKRASFGRNPIRSRCHGSGGVFESAEEGQKVNFRNGQCEIDLCGQENLIEEAATSSMGSPAAAGEILSVGQSISCSDCGNNENSCGDCCKSQIPVESKHGHGSRAPDVSQRMQLEGFDGKLSCNLTDEDIMASLRNRVAEVTVVRDDESICQTESDSDEIVSLDHMKEVISAKEADRLVGQCFSYVSDAFERMESNLSALEMLDKRRALCLMDVNTLLRLLRAAEESIQYLKVAYTRVQLNRSNPLNKEVVRKVNARLLEKNTNWHMTYTDWERRVENIRTRVESCPRKEEKS